MLLTNEVFPLYGILTCSEEIQYYYNALFTFQNEISLSYSKITRPGVIKKQSTLTTKTIVARTIHIKNENNSRVPLMSRVERKYCLISTSYLAGLFDIFILLHISKNWMCFGDIYQWGHFVMLIMRNLHLINVQSWTYLSVLSFNRRSFQRLVTNWYIRNLWEECDIIWL